MSKKTIIAGSRSFQDYDSFCKVLEHFQIDFILSGGARGADCMAERFAEERGIPIKVIPAKWNEDGISAGYKRNRELASEGDELIAFWDRESGGTANMILRAKIEELDITIIYVGD